MKILTLTLLALSLTGCGANPKLDRIASCAFLTVGSLGLAAPACIKQIKEANEAEDK